MWRKLTPGRLLLAAAVLAIATLFAAWLLPNGDYLYVPNSAQSLEGKVHVEGGRRSTAPGDIYYVDVTIRRETLLERLLPFLRPAGSSVVPRDTVVPPGSSFEQQRQEGLADMNRSEEVAAAVALRQAGFHVEAKPRGALIEGVALDAPAAKVLVDGDVIVSAAGRTVRTPAQLRAAVHTVSPGDTIALRVRRNGIVRDVSVKTVADPLQPHSPIIGIRVSQDANIKLPVKVSIDLGRVGGPSAGLPFALDVLEQLGKDVSHGYKVAATGEMEIDGGVYPIGGAKQKAVGVRKAGVDVFLVPAGENATDARRYAGNVRVIPVKSFQQALHALATLPKK